MRLPVAALAILVLVEPATLVRAVNPILWKRIIDVSTSYRPESRIEERVQHGAHSIVDHNLLHPRDVIPSPAATAPNVLESEVSIAAAANDIDSWNETTETACVKAFSDAQNITSSPCGIASCYNIRYFDNTTGVFQAELRLYRTSPATGNWTTIKSDGINVKVSCKGASIATGRMQVGKRDDSIVSWPRSHRFRLFRRVTPQAPEMLQQMEFYGEIHEELMGQIQTEASARSFLVPTIAFAATSEDGTPLVADLSSNSTSFVSGVFGPSQVGASTTIGSATATEADQGFVMPGRKLGIFPVGLIITSVWTALFLLTIGVGTVERVRFREAYRRRMKRELSVGIRTI